MKIFMEVTRDRYELPLIVADSSRELAQKSGANQDAVISTICKWVKGERKRSRFIRIEVEDEEIN